MNKMDEIKNHFEDEAHEFDEIILKLIPYYNEMIDALVLSIPYNYRDKISVLDLGCGTGTVSKKIKEKYFNAEITIVDISANMLKIAEQKINSENTAVINEDFYKFNFNQKYNVIVSSLALHHLITDDDKKKFYRNIFKNLETGGSFFNADVILGSDDHLQIKYMQKWIEFMNRKCAIDEINNKWLVKYNNEDSPAKLIDQLKWLEEIGFNNIDIIWKYYNFAVYGGYK